MADGRCTKRPYTWSASQVLLLMEHEARWKANFHVGIEHLIIALASVRGYASSVLKELGLDLDGFRNVAGSALNGQKVGREHLSGVFGGPGYTPILWKTILNAQALATEEGSSFVGTEHLLIALLAASEKECAGFLDQLGLRKTDAEQIINRLRPEGNFSIEEPLDG